MSGPDSSNSRPSQGRESPQRLDGLRILMVDDSADNRRLVDRFVALVGGHVDLAENGRVAMDKALSAAVPHDLVLMDIQMPEMDGIEATRRLRLCGYVAPIVALTASAVDDESECLLAGFDARLSKPIDRLALYEAIARHARRSSAAALDATVETAHTAQDKRLG